MRLIIKTEANTLYSVHLPNYLDVTNDEIILGNALKKMPPTAVYKSHHIHSDDLCDEERKQLDYFGKIKFPPIELNINLYEKE